MKKLLICACLFLPFAAALAQDSFRGAYFMDTYLYGHTMNPALTANRSYASVGLGDINIQAQSNLSASAFIYPTSGGAVTFLSDAVSSKDFLSKIHRHNTEQVDMRIDLLNFGFWTASRQFHTFSLNLRVAEGSSLPYDVFRFLKDGSSDGNYYDLSGAGLRVRGYAEAAYGISFPVTDAFRIGGKVKALVGLVYGDARFDRFDVTLSGEKWSVASDGCLLSSNLPVTQSNQAVRPQDIRDLDDFDPTELRPSGFGAGIDLGATWDVLPWLQLSASVTDLGFLRWKMDKSLAQGSWEYTGFENISFEGDNNFEQQMDAKMEQLQKLTEFRRSGSMSTTNMLPATFYLGAKAKPVDWFSAGLLGTMRMEGAYSWQELRGAVNLEPCHWFGWGGSIAYGTFGPKFSSLFNLRLGPFALTLGGEITSPYFVSSEPRAKHSLRDYFEGNVYAIPRDNLNANLMIGLNIVFGKTPARRAAAAQTLNEVLE